ncbi:ribonuclease H-like domain-containing protein [Zychaea mexicana]|uniref:ribonuclease H-like domain-containing protein n=1 Tax=Zychaea mexicana TaxID=64656 RepID=UPI0022FF3C7F|nr:ribonuclease H-like domain-containing protein [Zychaea mexicana]KAI9497392.1 ribonuclease H-like domain-containing protein [Zychaea mexicana]
MYEIMLNAATNFYKYDYTCITKLISQRLYDQFHRIYQPLLAAQPTLATEHAKAQESVILEKTSNQAGYKQMATNILMNLKKRPVAQNEQDIGIDGEWVDPATKAQQIVITLEKANKLVLTEEQLKTMGYPSAAELEQQGGDGQTVGSQKACDRCKKTYVVKDVLQESDLNVCQYHHGRMRMVMNRGEKLRLYTCCNESHGSMGCVKGPHVYKDENTQDLHAKIPFISTPEAGAAKESRTVVALDCEMAYTTAGMELVRVTAVDENCQILLDELVFPSHMVIDLNTRYSGIKTLAGAKHNLDSVRKELFKYVDANTILLGHGLENDMNALRLLHPKIIDTVTLYPHPKGLPFRYGLRVLSTKILQKFIQDSTEGHDSFEDAKTCVDLLEKYMKSPQGQKL